LTNTHCFPIYIPFTFCRWISDLRIKEDERILGGINFAETAIREADVHLDLLIIMDILELDFNNIHAILKS